MLQICETKKRLCLIAMKGHHVNKLPLCLHKEKYLLILIQKNLNSEAISVFWGDTQNIFGEKANLPMQIVLSLLQTLWKTDIAFRSEK